VIDPKRSDEGASASGIPLKNQIHEATFFFFCFMRANPSPLPEGTQRRKFSGSIFFALKLRANTEHPRMGV